METNARATQLVWGDNVSSLEPPFDYILASDVVYLKDTYKDLMKTVAALSDSCTVAFFAHEHREGTWEFFDMLKAGDFVVREVRVDLLSSSRILQFVYIRTSTKP